MAGVFEITVKTHFSAAHSLKGYPGDCAGLHGHNWNVEVSVDCKELDQIGIGIDFREVKRHINDILHDMDHRHLNALSAFQNVNPTSENVAKFLYRQLSEKLNTAAVHVAKVNVSETPDCGASYREE